MSREVLLVVAIALLAAPCSAQDEDGAPRLERTLGSTRWRARWSGAADVVVMPDGQRVVHAAMGVVLADLQTGHVLRSFDRPGPGGRMGGEDDHRLALSPDGAYLVVVGDPEHPISLRADPEAVLHE